MAERRMFTKKVTDDDNFMALSSSAQALYLHLSMGADDDGFCNQINVSMFKAHASVQDLQALLEKRYIYQFENGVIVIKHWRMANALRKDRYTQTAFKEELSKLHIKDNGAYTLDQNEPLVAERLPVGCQEVAKGLPDGCQVVADCLPQVSIGKNSIEENRVEKSSEGEVSAAAPEPTTFVPPTKEEIIAYITPLGLKFDVDRFFDFYSSNGWMVSGRKMRDWKGACRYWASTEYRKKDQNANMKTHDWDYDALEQQASQLSDDWLERLKKRAGS